MGRILSVKLTADCWFQCIDNRRQTQGVGKIEVLPGFQGDGLILPKVGGGWCGSQANNAGSISADENAFSEWLAWLGDGAGARTAGAAEAGAGRNDQADERQ